MEMELPSFCQYLMDLPTIDYKDYNDNGNWKTEDYQEYIYETTSPTDRLKEAAEEKNLSKFIYELTEASVSYADIDEMFKVSTNRGARCLLYNTSSTLVLDYKSLEDIAGENYNLDTDIRARFKNVKSRRDYKGGKIDVKINVIEFPTLYRPLSLDDDIAPISDVKIEPIEFN